MKILIVDDSVSELNKLKQVIEKAGHIVIVARNGQEAIDMSLTNMPDMIFMDIVMPVMDGFKATRNIKSNDKIKHIPIILVSTKNQAVDIAWAKKQGANDLIGKPFEPSHILTKLSQFQ